MPAPELTGPVTGAPSRIDAVVFNVAVDALLSPDIVWAILPNILRAAHALFRPHRLSWRRFRTFRATPLARDTFYHIAAQDRDRQVFRAAPLAGTVDVFLDVHFP
ncbi:hypothetical protein BE04_03955 [Sorangium cellulosum]|uniref:Uncharacterized protein n=1 Tax=Sorangium cellulosum TaxID=56 RepID=A0A150NYC7_SORCE|nr:hypothetical protein BE04_03955 [Sorangium cellulosum]